MTEIERRSPEEQAAIGKVQGIVGETIAGYKMSADLKTLVQKRMGEILGPIASSHPGVWGEEWDEIYWGEVAKLYSYNNKINKIGPIPQLQVDLRAAGINPGHASRIVDNTLRKIVHVLEGGFSSLAEANKAEKQTEKPVTIHIPIVEEHNLVAEGGQRHTRWQGNHREITSDSLYFPEPPIRY